MPTKGWRWYTLTPTAALQTQGNLRENRCIATYDTKEWLLVGGKVFLRVLSMKYERATKWVDHSLNYMRACATHSVAVSVLRVLI